MVELEWADDSIDVRSRLKRKDWFYAFDSIKVTDDPRTVEWYCDGFPITRTQERRARNDSDVDVVEKWGGRYLVTWTGDR